MFNSGILVLSLKRWRDEKLADFLLQTRDRILAKGLSLRFQDQDVLNVALGSRIHALPPDWNVTPLYLPVKFWARDDLSLVNILHFVTNPKPWNGNQWMKLPAQAVKAYAVARSGSAANAEDSQRWRTYFEWYEQITNGGTTPLTPARMRRLRKLVAAYKHTTDVTPGRAPCKPLHRASRNSSTIPEAKRHHR
jgi:lipopolysaccharide biosynthesis glycosyltransferase